MNVLQLIGTILYSLSLATIIARIISEKKGKTAELAVYLISGIILGSADEWLKGLNLKIAASLSIFAALLISAPFIQFKKKGER
jgi:hypothetical protein